MPKPAIDTQHAELKVSQLASPEDMERRRELVAGLRALWSRPVTDEEKEFWRQFDEELEQEHLTFR